MASKQKLNYTDGENHYFFTIENGLYNVLWKWDKEKKKPVMAKWGQLNDKKHISREFNLKRVPVKDQETVFINQ